jgi:hypothetical protein
MRRALVVAWACPAAVAWATPAVSVRAGAAAAVLPGRAAPSVELGASTPLGTGPVRLEALFGAWTLASGVAPGAETELMGLVAPTWGLAMGERWTWRLGVGPALRVADGPASSPAFRVGAGINPGLSMSTRRASLSIDLGARALLFTDGARFSFLTGATYSFR